jgi:hypothetical protein
MDKKKSQHFNYCYEAIPIMFHSQTKDFMKYIDRDGLNFLEFWWMHVGEQLPFERLSQWVNVNYEIMTVQPNMKVIFVSLPYPQVEGEMYFLALVGKPEKKFGWVRLPNTRVIGLVRRSKEKFPEGTELGDITPRAIYVPIGAGPAPTMQAFKQAVLERIKLKAQK